MNEAAAKLLSVERAVMWRKRWLALQDHLALALLATGLMAAALVVLSRLRIARRSLASVERPRRTHPQSPRGACRNPCR